MSYDTLGLRLTYMFPALTNATVAAAAAIRVPPGVRFCFMEDIWVTPSVAIVNTTTPGILQLGTTATSGKFAAQNISTVAGLALGTAYGSTDLDGRVAQYNPTLPRTVNSAGTVTQEGFIDLYNDADTVGTIPNYLKIGTVVGVTAPAGTFTAFFQLRWY